MTVYHLSGIRKIYGSRTVLDIPAMKIEKNRIYALLGPNGAGKTTLLNILGFLETPSAGKIDFREKPVRFSASALQALRRDVVMVDQHPILFTTTVFKNLEFGLKIRKIVPKQRKRIIEESLELVGMRDFITAPAHTLSGGETQRVALARALALKPEVFLCDEPTSSTDIENQAIIINLLRQINATRHITIIFTTHDRTQAAGIAHKTLVLNHGKLVAANYENIFSVLVTHNGNGHVRCRLNHDVSLSATLPATYSGNGRTRIFIDPHQIISESGVRNPESEIKPQKSSNKLQGKVHQIIRENKDIRMVVDSGVWLTMIMSESVYRQNRPSVGDTVDCYIPPEAIHTIR
ncbi:ABC transporter ATP-binding protein [Desulfococcaceae bacterium HSG9]|nr:ABC transporter ATP-binding protein [Desulfococcaceae bacterium HSG9]